jgi:ferritin
MNHDLIGETLRLAICYQIGHEKYNSNLYMYICGYLRNKGLDNLAKHFEGQHEEEFQHSMEFFNLLTDLNGDVIIPEIDEISMPFSTILEIANAYLEREILTTKSIEEIKRLSIEQGNSVVEEKMREMITKQQKEYEEATSFLDKASILSEWWQVALWDAASK